MKRKLKVMAVVMAALISSFFLSGCWNSRELNTLAFVTSMGFDKTDKGIQMTVQVFNPRAIASQKSVNETSVIVYTQEGKDAMEMIRRMSTQSPRRINGTHLQTVVFGEEFARDGISAILDFFAREHQNRTDFYFIVAKGTTANNILSTQTKLETNPSNKLFSSLKASEQGFSAGKSVKLNELINSIIAEGKNPVLTGVQLTDDRKDKNSVEELENMQQDPIKIEDMAVFQKDKFIGWLNEDESKGYNFLIGNVSSTIGYVEDKEVGKISIEVTGTDTEQKTVLKEGKPEINVNIHVTGNIESVSGDYDVTKEENVHKIESLAQQKVLTLCLQSLKKAQELGSDIFGFGEVVHRSYPQLWKAMKGNWNQEFHNLPVHVSVVYTIQKTGTIAKSFFEKDKE